MTEGAVFGEKSTREDSGAIMNYARIAPPAPKTNYVDIAGGDSSIDLSEAVGVVTYEDGSIDFLFTFFSRSAAEKMKNDLHGRRVEIVLEREKEYCYDGRISAGRISQEGRIFEMSLSARIKPYKYEKKEIVHEERLDGRTKEILLENDAMPAMPRIKVDGEVTLLYDGIGYRMVTGEYQVPEITLYAGINRLRLSGKGTVVLTYRKGRLA